MDALVDPGKPFHVFADGVLVICRAGADDDEKAVIFSGYDICYFLIPFLLKRMVFRLERVFVLNFFRGREFLFEFEGHGGTFPGIKDQWSGQTMKKTKSAGERGQALPERVSDKSGKAQAAVQREQVFTWTGNVMVR